MVAKKKKPSTAVMSMADMEAQMEQHATSAKARVHQPTGNVIGIKNSKKFTFKKEVIGNELDVYVLDFAHVNTYYEQAYDPDNPTPPSCFALSHDGEEMKPDPSAPAPQADYCDGCPMNAWGSAEKGDGKACKNGYRLAVMETDAKPEEAEIAVLSLPPTSLKNWDNYVRDLVDKMKRSPNGVQTLFTFDDDEEWPVLVPSVSGAIKKPAIYAGILSRMEAAKDIILEPFDVSGYEAKPKPKRKTAARKTTAKKTTAKKRAPAKRKTTTRKKATGKSKFA